MPLAIEAIGPDHVRYFGVWRLVGASPGDGHRLWAPGGRDLRYDYTVWDGKLDMWVESLAFSASSYPYNDGMGASSEL